MKIYLRDLDIAYPGKPTAEAAVVFEGGRGVFENVHIASGGDLTFSVYRYNPRAMDGYKGSFLVYGLDIISKKEDGEFFDWLLKMFPQIIPYFYRGYTHFQKDGTIQEQMMWEYHMDIHKYTRLLKLKRTYNAHEPKV